MPLNKAQLKNDLIAMSEELFNNSANLTPTQAREQWATAMSNAFDSFVKGADGHYQGGSLTAGSTPVTGNGQVAIKII